MEASSCFALAFFIKMLQLLSIVTLTLSLASAPLPTSSKWNDADRLSLLAIKSQIELDAMGALSSWNDSLHHCYWKGITCSRRHLGRVTMLDLYSQQLEGTLSPYLGNLTFLSEIDLEDNNFHGVIPKEIGGLHRLRVLFLSRNSFIGEIFIQLNNCSNLRSISFIDNQLEGSLPPDIGFTFPKIYWIGLRNNRFSGPIPTTLANATNLEVFDISMNNFIGPLPTYLGRLQGLRVLSLFSNQLGTRTGNDLKVINSLTNSTGLEVLELADNFLKGPLPVSISNLSSKLIFLDASENMLYGDIPAGLGNFLNLENLQLQINVLSGPIPASLGNLTKLSGLNLGANKLDGSIPPTLGNCINLLRLNISHNNLVGIIPPQLFGVNLHTIGLDFSNNAFIGSLPSQVSNLTKLVDFLLSNNKLSGHLPESLGNCLSLENLYLENNVFQGEIPKSFKMLRGLNNFDLSQNNFSGRIPDFLGKLPLQYLNLSFNHLEGEVPNIGIFENTSAFFVDGNTKLCGGIRGLKLPSCMQKGKKSSPSIKVILPMIVGSLCLLAFSCTLLMCYKRKTLRRKLSSRAIFTLWYKRVSYGELLKATNGFSDDNLVGLGHHGSVYKGILEQINKTVAVKVIKLQIEGASKSFLKECNALRHLRHRNLLKIITACSTVDFKGNDFKALVFDFMANGSLESWLHPRADEQQTVSRVLNFIHRLNIANDVALALEYLHHHCQPYFVHCDVKPSNVLLDDEMTAHVADFGIAKMFATSSHDYSQSLASSIVIKGSIGYVAPEYGAGSEVSTRGDVYSYGILLLEMFTGKKPTNDMFVSGLNLHDYVKMALPDQVTNIIDPVILREEIDVLNTMEQSETRSRLHESLVSMIRMAVTCSDQSPVKRMTMSEVLIELQHINEHYQGVRVIRA